MHEVGIHRFVPWEVKSQEMRFYKGKLIEDRNFNARNKIGKEGKVQVYACDKSRVEKVRYAPDKSIQGIATREEQ